jgi:hypothetical protein
MTAIIFVVVIILIAKYVPANWGSNSINTMAQAIQSFEGWSAGSRSFRNNNPGNLKFASQAGATEGENGFAVFNSYTAGYQALVNLITSAFNGSSYYYRPDMSLYDFFSVYSEDNSVPYAEFVASQLGVSPDTKLQNLA